jgi:phage gp46-like protein
MSAQTLSWKLDSNSGDYVLNSKGNAVIDTTFATPAIIRLRAQRTQWMYAPDINWGSDYYTTTVRLNNSKLLDNIGTRALQPLVTEGLALNVQVQTVAASRINFTQQATIVENNGQQTTVNFSPVGNI